MSYSAAEIKTMRGLFLQSNSYQAADGSLELAENVTISSDNIISSRRGFYRYFSPDTDTKNLIHFDFALMCIGSDQMAIFDDLGPDRYDVGEQTLVSGEPVVVTGERTPRSMLASANLYFTTDEGVLKLGRRGEKLRKSGAPEGLDVSLTFVSNTTSQFFAPIDGQDTQLAYRVVFGYKDSRDNLILGAPSSPAILENNVQEGTWVRAANTVSVTTTAVHSLISGDSIVVVASEGGEPDVEETTYTVSVDSPTTFSFTHTAADDAAGNTLSFALAMRVKLEITLPYDITSGDWFYQVYRSSQQKAAVGLFSDYRLVSEEVISAAHIEAGKIFFSDDLSDSLLGAELYTNENSREGELQANARPPLAEDIALFGEYAIYSQVTTRAYVDLAIIDPLSIPSGSQILIKGEVNTRYVARSGVANRTVRMILSDDAGEILFSFLGHDFEDGDLIEIDEISGTLAAGRYFVRDEITDSFKVSATSGGAALSYTDESSALVQGVLEPGGNPMFYSSSADSAAVRLRDTAEALVKAINRLDASEVIAVYVSTIFDIPGNFRLARKTWGGSHRTYVQASSQSVGEAFSPALTEIGVDFQSIELKGDKLPHTFFASKRGEPEAVPIINSFPVGSKNSKILRHKALRDSLIILKEDGVYRVTGDQPANFVVTLIDGTVSCLAKNSVAVINNNVGFLSNQGVCFVTESSVQILSRQGIEDPVQPILGQRDLSEATAALAYESERLYIMTTATPNDPSASVTYVYNILTREWTTWDFQFRAAAIGPLDRLFYLESSSGDIFAERKKQTLLDYADGFGSAVVHSISGTLVEATFNGVQPKIGDVLVKNDVLSWIEASPVLLAGDRYQFTIDRPNNITVGDKLEVHQGFEKRIKFSPIHLGRVGLMKFFAKMSVHLRTASISKARITFASDTYGSSEEIDWVSPQTFAGWGLFPWGLEPWGQQNGIDLKVGTSPSPPIVVPIPSFAARSTFIQPIISCSRAAEKTDIQALHFSVRPYGERISR